VSAHIPEDRYDGCTVRTWERGGAFFMHIRWPDGRWQRSSWEHGAADAGRGVAAWILRHGGREASLDRLGDTA